MQKKQVFLSVGDEQVPLFEINVLVTVQRIKDLVFAEVSNQISFFTDFDHHLDWNLSSGTAITY